MKQITLARRDREGGYSKIHIVSGVPHFSQMVFCKSEVSVFAPVDAECVRALSTLGVLCNECVKKWMQANRS